MKLYKNNLTFDQNIMKLKYLIPFYALLLTITFCSRKASEKKEETAVPEKTETQKTLMSPADSKVTGTLELDQATNTIYANITVMVSSADFKYANQYMALQTTTPGAYKGLVLRYYDTVNNAPDNGPATVPMTVQYSFPNTKNWRENDQIRVMTLNEDSPTIFTGLTPYFMLRMQSFQNTAITYPQLQSFNAAWNTANPNNQVVTGSNTSEGNGTGKQVAGFIPRLTKDDGILSLKLKK